MPFNGINGFLPEHSDVDVLFENSRFGRYVLVPLVWTHLGMFDRSHTIVLLSVHNH